MQLKVACMSCSGSGRSKLPMWDADRFIFEERDLGPCYSCGGLGYTKVYDMVISDRSSPWPGATLVESTTLRSELWASQVMS
jgi:hypothetical protein